MDQVCCHYGVTFPKHPDCLKDKKNLMSKLGGRISPSILVAVIRTVQIPGHAYLTLYRSFLCQPIFSCYFAGITTQYGDTLLVSRGLQLP